MTDRFRLMLVDTQHRLVGLLDILVQPGHDVDSLGSWLRKSTERLCHDLHRARAVERSLEPKQALGTVWIRPGQRAQPCRAARTVWSHPLVQHRVQCAVTGELPEHIDFVGPQCICTSRLSDSQLVWLLPSDDIQAPLIGKLRPALRRVAGALSSGATAPAIATDLGRGHETVRSHIRSIYQELGVDSRVGVAQLASQVYWS